MTVLEELEQIDDDCDKHGIQFVKIDDAKAAADYGIDSVRSQCSRSRYFFDANHKYYSICRFRPLFTLKKKFQMCTTAISWTRSRF